MPGKFKNKYRISSARLSNWDYSSNAAYFITICTADRKHYFGNILNLSMQLSKVGEFAKKCWMNIPDHFPHFYLDAFVVMPNHVHGIVMIRKPYIDNNSLINVVETGYALSLQEKSTQETTDQVEEEKERHPRFRNQGRNTISAMVGSFKSAVSKYCNERKLGFGWQTRFYDHIIRNNNEFHVVRNYIINNPVNWKGDKFYSDDHAS